MRRSAIVLALLVAACGRGAEPAAPDPAGDPLLAAALLDPIASDPDLASQNRANAVASLTAPDGTVPSLDTGPEAIARARADALALIGGPGGMRQAPAPDKSEGALPPQAALSAAARAAYTPRTRGCAAAVQYSAAWAAQLPPAFPVYPRGAVQEAAGTDADRCALRVVNFQTPVPLDEVMDFYYSRARQAGVAARHLKQGTDDVLAGARARASFTVYARPLSSGGTEVDLVTSG